MSATEPLDSGEVFSELCPSMREYLESAKKLSKQHKHFFLGQEHFLAAFLLNSNSVIRKYIDQPKWNAKKKVQSLLQKAYPQAKNGAKWNGFIVTPRMQDTWSDAIQLTQFGEPTDVHEVHILDSMFTKINRPIKKWLQSENLDDEKELMSFFERELEEFKNSSHEEDFVQKQPAKSSNPFAIFNIFKPKEKNIEIKVHDSYAKNNDSYEEDNSYDNSYSENNYDNNYNEPVPSEDVSQQEASFEEPIQQHIEPVQQEVKEKSVDKNRVLRVGDSYTYQESELVARGMPASIIDAFMQLADEYGPLPERILFNKRKIYFENLLYENLTLEEYQVVVSDLEDSIKAALSRSPFRSSSTASPSTHSLFNRKTTEEVKTEEAPPAYTPVVEEAVVEEPAVEETVTPTFDDSVPAYTPVEETVEEPVTEESSVPTFDNSVPAFTPVEETVEAPVAEESSVPVFDNSVPAYTPVEETVEDNSVMTPVRPDNEETFSASVEPSVEEVTVDIDDVTEEDIQHQEEQKVVNTTEEVKPNNVSEESTESAVVEEEIEDEQEDIVSNVRYIKGASPSAIYLKYMEHVDISSMLKDSKSLYLTKDIENLQEGFHWSEMLDFVPVNSVSPTPKLGKVDLEMITVGILEKKS